MCGCTWVTIDLVTDTRRGDDASLVDGGEPEQQAGERYSLFGAWGEAPYAAAGGAVVDGRRWDIDAPGETRRQRCQSAAGRRGTTTVNVEPRPGSLCTSMRPPWSSMMR